MIKYVITFLMSVTLAADVCQAAANAGPISTTATTLNVTIRDNAGTTPRPFVNYFLQTPWPQSITEGQNLVSENHKDTKA